MKLFLCGGGCGKQIEQAFNKFKKVIDTNKPILYIPLAMDSSKYNSCFKWFSSELSYFGLDKFEMVTSSEELSKKDFSKYSSLFIGGGNTFKLLNDLNEFDNLNKIKNYLNNDGIVFGASAGAIIFGKDINSCLLDDKNIVSLKNTKGLNMINDYSVLCHYKNKNYKRNYEHLKEYSLTNKTIYLPEEDVIYVSDKKVSFIGTSKYVIFKKGKPTIHNFANFKKDIN